MAEFRVERFGVGQALSNRDDLPEARGRLRGLPHAERQRSDDVLRGGGAVLVHPVARPERQQPLAVAGQHLRRCRGPYAAAVALEHLLAIKRAGADFILTYLAREVAETLSA